MKKGKAVRGLPLFTFRFAASAYAALSSLDWPRIFWVQEVDLA